MGRRRLLKLLPPLLLAGLGVAATGGCGYQLRSAGGTAATFSGLRLRIVDAEGGFERMLRRGLMAGGTALYVEDDTAAADFPLLLVGAERFFGRPASTTPQARTAQVTVQLSIRVHLAAGETALIDDETITVERTYYQDLRTIAGNREEADLLREEMRRELVNRVLRRLEAAGG